MNTTKKAIIILLSSLCGTGGLAAQKHITVSTQNTCLALKVTDKKQLEQVYFGNRLKNDIELQTAALPAAAAYSTFGAGHTFEAALRAVQTDGNTSTDLRYVSHRTEAQGSNIIQTTISLKDAYYELNVDLCYKAYQKEDVIEQWVEIKNNQAKSITLHNFASSDLSFKAAEYYVTQFHGNWAEEMKMSEQLLDEGIKIIDSKLGVRSNQFTHPCFLLSLGQPAREDNGEVVGGTLAWPGSFQFCFEVDPLRNLRVLSGINPYASTYTLEKGKTFKTPALLYTYSNSGTGTVSRRFHRWARQYGVKNGSGERSILLNNWEATYFDFDEAKLVQIIDDAAKMGFELFLLDDGWFGNKYPRDSDKAGLGDWQTNTKKLPHGIPFLIEEAHKRGLKFGIWVEPEMVNPKSELYEKHPDWIITQPHRELSLMRNQLLLDLSNPKVQEFVFNVIDNILAENPGIDYVKWDCNRYITTSGSQYLKPEQQSHLWIDNANAILGVMEKVSAKYPNVCFMACSGGGGRMDYGSMKHFDEFWISDNNDPLQRIFTQWGGQYFFPAIGMASHVSASPNHISGRSAPLKYRFDIAMAAKLGMDMQPVQMTEEEKEFSRQGIATYKQIRPTILHGDLYRLLSPYEHNRTAYMYVSENKQEAVVFNFLVRKDINGDRQTVLLKGLDPDKEYMLLEINREAGKGKKSRISEYEGKKFSGDYLMTVGLRFTMSNEYESVVIRVGQSGTIRME
ncbi:MAG: alpha-galactosidase [Prevotellaceae bacterium]|jgi:alpha-galactosidase|nr:alpha-galactosidase [Prevotellaceae bacterium]